MSELPQNQIEVEEMELGEQAEEPDVQGNGQNGGADELGPAEANAELRGIPSARAVSSAGPVPARSLLCVHYSASCGGEGQGEPRFECAVQTLQCRVFNRTRNILAAIAGAPVYQRKKESFGTQTIAQRQEHVQTSRVAGVQPANPRVYGSEYTAGEYQMTGRASRYVTSEVFLERKLRAVVLIQSYIRRYNAAEKVFAIKEAAEQKAAAQEAERVAVQTAQEAYKMAELQRRVQPKSAQDFALLREEIETWVRQQKFSIEQAKLPAEARQAAQELLVEKEARLLANVDGLRRAAGDLQQRTKTGEFFKKISEPRLWQLSSGEYVRVATPYTMRACVLRDLYYELEDWSRDIEGRLDTLLRVKYVLREFDCALTREGIRLIDEEADLLSRARPAESLQGLRKRLQQTLLSFCENPEFNPAVRTILKDDQIIYRPNTLPITEGKKRSPQEKEALARLKNNALRKGVYGQLDTFKKQFGILGLSGALRTVEGGAEEQLVQSTTQEIENNQEAQAEAPGAFALIVDQARFDADGKAFKMQRSPDGYELLGADGAVWIARQFATAE